MTNLAHYVRPNSDVLVVGVGGGRDILSALAFDQKSVTGVEINDQILHAINVVYGDFTGHLDRNPRVTFANDEARSYIARSKKHYDIIQLSLTDTWAASAAGAYALSENSLYTVDAWDTFMDHLNANGVLTVSRWYYPAEPAEAYRLATLAMQSLRDRGVENPRDHIFMAKGPSANGISAATILVSPSPFTSQDIATLQKITDQMKFELVLTPTFAIDSVFGGIAEAKDVNAFAAGYHVNIAPPTDDKPFFFQMIRLGDLFHGNLPGAKYLDGAGPRAGGADDSGARAHVPLHPSAASADGKEGEDEGDAAVLRLLRGDRVRIPPGGSLADAAADDFPWASDVRALGCAVLAAAV